MQPWKAAAALALCFASPALAAPRVLAPVVRILPATLPVSPPPFSPPFDPPSSILREAGRRYGVDPDPDASPDLGEGDWGQVRSGRLAERVPAFLRAEGFRPGMPLAVKIPYADPGGMILWEAVVGKRLAEAGGERLFMRGTYDSQLGLLVMPKLRGYRSLESVLEKGALGPERRERIARELKRALEVLKSAGLVHSDLRPANILVSVAGRIKILDYGIAAERGAYAPYPHFEGWRGGHHLYASSNQRANGPAAYADDRHAVAKLLRLLPSAEKATGSD